MTLGQKINILRSEKGLTQKELATQLGVTTGTIAEWEADEATPNLAELSRLSKALNVSSDVLLETTAEEIASPVEQPKQEQSPVVAPVKKRKKTGWIIGAAVVLITLVIGVLFLFRSTPFSENASAIETADASVVTIFCYDYEGELAATGSGFVAFDGKTIITNYHVMTSAYTCKISTNQDISYDVSGICCSSEEQDIAILELAEDTNLTPLSMGDSKAIKKGETVVAIGSPLGIKNTVSTGVLSGRLMENNMDVLQFTAPISSGSSGGALFDNNGNVIGITYASYIDGQNLNLAIPIEIADSLYRNRGSTKKVSVIYTRSRPYVPHLEKYKGISEITIDELLANPEKYYGQTIKVYGYLSSFFSEWHTFTFGLREIKSCFIAPAIGVTEDGEYDNNVYDSAYFGEIPYLAFKIRLDGNNFLSTDVEPGDMICWIGTFNPSGGDFFSDIGDTELLYNCK